MSLQQLVHLVEKYFKQPDDLVTWLIKSVTGSGLALLLWLLYTVTMSWVGFMRGSVRASVAASRMARGTYRRVTSMTIGRIGISLLVTTVLLALEVAWLLSVVVMTNFAFFAYQTTNEIGQGFFSLNEASILHGFRWLDMNTASRLALIVGAAAIVISAARKKKSTLLLVVLCAAPVIWGAGFLLVVAAEILTLVTRISHQNLLWHTAYLFAVAIYVLAGQAALAAASRIGELWRGRERG